MKTAASTVLLAGLCASLTLPSAIAQETLVTFRSLAPGVALEMAQASLERCRDDGGDSRAQTVQAIDQIDRIDQADKPQKGDRERQNFKYYRTVKRDIKNFYPQPTLI